MQLRLVANVSKHLLKKVCAFDSTKQASYLPLLYGIHCQRAYVKYMVISYLTVYEPITEKNP